MEFGIKKESKVYCTKFDSGGGLMTSEENLSQKENLKQKVKNIKPWKKGDERAPHKPLLILYALGQLQSKGTNQFNYENVKEDLKILLEDFGHPNRIPRPEYPFVRLTTDSIWELNKEVQNKDKATDSWLRKNQVIGGFSDDVYSLLKDNNDLIKEIAEILLDKCFPETLHDDILMAVGLDFSTKYNKTRDPKFREKILRAYENRCAICGFYVRLKNKLVAVEAAHIKWHNYGGPDEESNGMALCTMHHKLFDKGVFTINRSYKILVSEDATGDDNVFSDWLMKFHNEKIQEPIRREYYPSVQYVDWHVREVFKEPAREYN